MPDLHRRCIVAPAIVLECRLANPIESLPNFKLVGMTKFKVEVTSIKDYSKVVNRSFHINDELREREREN